MVRSATKCLAVIALMGLTGCTAFGNLLNPFYEPPTEEALLGQPNDHALNDSREKEDTARAAFEQAGQYQRALPPQPVNPVLKPAIVRLMWIPDHLNKSGDLIPAHYYYLKVMDDRFAATDAFEIEGQLNKSTGDTSAIPFVTEDR